jgi:hypothetical protein
LGASASDGNGGTFGNRFSELRMAQVAAAPAHTTTMTKRKCEGVYTAGIALVGGLAAVGSAGGRASSMSKTGEVGFRKPPGLTEDSTKLFEWSPGRGPSAMAAIDEKLLEERLTALESARAWSPRLVSKLESHIRSGSDAELLRMNPLRFAADKGLAGAETIDLFLHAVPSNGQTLHAAASSPKRFERNTSALVCCCVRGLTREPLTQCTRHHP